MNALEYHQAQVPLLCTDYWLMKLYEIHIVQKLAKAIRIQDYAVGIFRNAPTKSALKKAIKQDRVYINGMVAQTSRILEGYEKIELFAGIDTPREKKLNLPLKVLYEDDWIAAVQKPAGIAVSGNRFRTVCRALPGALNLSPSIDACLPHPVHRLDYATSGVLLVGKTQSSIRSMNKLFQERKIIKTYHAVSIGKMELDNSSIEIEIEGRKAHTYFEILECQDSVRFDSLNLLRINPLTGRRHQIRKHLLAIGHPVLGDKKYCPDDKKLYGKGLYLHASRLQFRHPENEKNLDISDVLPAKFGNIFKSAV